MPRSRAPIAHGDPEWRRLTARYLVSFRGPVLFEEDSVRELCRLAREGFETRLKKETYGFLFGALNQDRRLLVRRACYYRGGTKTRTGVVFKDWATIRRLAARRVELARELRMRFAGSFHSHVEIAGEVFRGLSESDRLSFREDPMSTLEVIVFIWKGENHPAEHSPRDIVGFEPRSGYNYRIRAYAKKKNGVRHTRARVVASGVAIVY